MHSDDLINIIKPVNLVFENANEIILDENSIVHILNGRSIKMSKRIFSKEKSLHWQSLKMRLWQLDICKTTIFIQKDF